MQKLLGLIFQIFKVFLLFIIFTVVFYFALNWFNDEYQGLRRYDTPTGDAVKVFRQNQVNEGQYVKRLLEYYLSGE